MNTYYPAAELINFDQDLQPFNRPANHTDNSACQYLDTELRYTMHLIELVTISLCLLMQVSTRAAPRPLLVARQGSAKLQSSPLPAPVDTPLPDASDEVSTTSTTVSNHVVSSKTSTKSASATPTGPRNHNVAVAQNGTQFTPSSLKNIPVGDTLTFYFYPRNYSVIQSTFAAPCQPVHQGLYTGFRPTEDNNGIAREKFVVTVEATETKWFYGVDGAILASGGMNVCEKGMAMVLNPLPKDSAGGQTLGTYRRNAADNVLNGNRNHTAQVPGETSLRGGEVRGITQKEKDRWESKHPLGGNVAANATAASTAGVGRASGTHIATFENVGVVGKGNSFMAIAVLVGTSVFGLRF